ncbi:MAG TPA: hypothetical protein DGZ94_10340 [Serratia sp.]|nr:hypothetical protein [Serratia sp. (in: enterobacteria)]
MNITFTPEPIPELTITGVALAELVFGIGTPLQLTLRPDGLWLTIRRCAVRGQPAPPGFGG